MAYPDEKALTTLATLKSWLEVDASETSSDVALSTLITRVSTLVTSLLHREYFLTRNYRDTCNGNNSNYMALNVTPVTAVTSVTIDGVSVPATTGYYTAGYTFDENGVYVSGYTFDGGFRNVVIVYTGGLATSNYRFSMLEQACLEICNFKWKRRDHPDQSWQDLGRQITAKYSTEAIPKEAQLTIQQFMRVIPFNGTTEIVVAP